MTRGSWAQLFWTRSDSRYFSEEKSIRFPIKADGLFHIYTLCLSNSSEWKDTVTQLRFDPTDAADSEIEIDYIRIPEEIWPGLLLVFSAWLLRRRNLLRRASAPRDGTPPRWHNTPTGAA